MKTITNVFEDVSIGIGVFLGISQIETILGIILLCFQIVLILYKFIRKIIEHVQKRDLDGIQKDLEETINDIEKLSDKDKDGKQ